MCERTTRGQAVRVARAAAPACLRSNSMLLVRRRCAHQSSKTLRWRSSRLRSPRVYRGRSPSLPGISTRGAARDGWSPAAPCAASTASSGLEHTPQRRAASSSLTSIRAMWGSPSARGFGERDHRKKAPRSALLRRLSMCAYWRLVNSSARSGSSQARETVPLQGNHFVQPIQRSCTEQTVW